MAKCDCINLGDFKHPIDIFEQEPVARRSGGGRDTAWLVKFSSVFAKITPSQQNDLLEAQGLDQQVSHKIIIRFIEGLTSHMRIQLYKERFMFIKSFINIEEQSKFLEIKALESSKAAKGIV